MLHVFFYISRYLMHCGEYMFTLLLGAYSWVEFLSHGVSICSALTNTTKELLKVVAPVCTPTSSEQTLGAVSF
jgi:hypothetical protein